MKALHEDIQSRSGIFRGQVHADGEHRIGAFERLPDHALVAYVSLPRNYFLTVWLHDQRMVIPLFLGYVLLVLLGGRMMARREARHIDRLLDQARRDPMTGLPNRLAALELLQRELARAERRGG